MAPSHQFSCSSWSCFLRNKAISLLNAFYFLVKYLRSLLSLSTSNVLARIIWSILFKKKIEREKKRGKHEINYYYVDSISYGAVGYTKCHITKYIWTYQPRVKEKFTIVFRCFLSSLVIMSSSLINPWDWSANDDKAKKNMTKHHQTQPKIVTI